MLFTIYAHKICIKNRGKGDSVKILIIPFPLLFQTTNTLTHFLSLVSFYTPWKHKKSSDFLMI